MQILIPAVERNSGYDDLDVLITSLYRYNYDSGFPIIVAYNGYQPDCDFRYIDVTLVPQWETNKCYGDACKQLINISSGEDLLFLNDDTVITPTTIQLLLEDINILKKNNLPIGLIGLRSNYTAGIQNIRTPHGTLNGIKYAMEDSIVEVDQVFGVAFYTTRSALNSIPDDWTHLNWYSDNLLSYDLKQKGYRHFVSRSYLHHHGAQSTPDFEKADKEGRDWLKANREDFYATL